MYFQIAKIILWPRKTQYNFKTIDFDIEKINVITGASRTGKSAIIPIIDYCLGESKCHIPVKTIRDACCWFGVVIKLLDREILLARREPGEQKSTDDMMIHEGKKIIIPQKPSKNTTRLGVCKYLDEISKITFLRIEDEDKGFNERPSFRDMLAFCFQTQNIVANANTLFYKADTTEHRNKLINIFPYVLGAVTSEILVKRRELDELERKLKRKERDLLKIQEVSERWKTEISGWINAAQEYGLISLEYPVEGVTIERQLELLKEISHQSIDSALILRENIEKASKEMIELRKEENQLSLELSRYKSRYFEMTRFVENIEEYRKTLAIQADRLSVSRWIKELSEPDGICPFCGGNSYNVQKQIDELVYNLEEIEKESEGLEEIPAAFEREYSMVQGMISKLTEKLSSVQKRIIIQNDVRDKSREQQYTLESVSRFLGKIQYAEETYRAIGIDGELQEEIKNLRSQIVILRQQVDEAAIKRKLDVALKNIQLKVMKLLPTLDIERPQDNVEIDYKNLTISVSEENGRKDYLWEIGSGSNWLAYHISVSLAFQMFFSEQKQTPVPQFLVYDQPSQVYFPRKMAMRQDDIDEEQELADEDVVAVKKIFLTMSRVLKQTEPRIQIIVLEHASENAWEGVEDIHLVEEWRGEDNKLIPKEWIL